MTIFGEPFLSALKALQAHKLRSALTALGIIIGVSAVIVVVSLVRGLERQVLKEVEKAGSQTLLIRPIFPSDLPAEEYAKIKNRDLTLEHLKELKHTLPQIARLAPIFQMGALLQVDGRNAQASLVMTDDNYLELNAVDLAMGRNFVPGDLRLRAKVAIVGKRVLEKLGIQGDPIGKQISMPSLSLEIIGVLKEQGASLGDDPDNRVLIPISTGMGQLSALQRRNLFCQAQIEPSLSVEDGAELVKESLRRIKGTKVGEPNGFQVFTLKQIAGLIGSLTSAITAVAGGMVSVALIVGGIGIMNIMLVSVTERTREIGLRKAMGARRKHILLQFLIEAALLCVMGGVVGIVLGYAIGAIVGKALMGQVGTIPLWAVICAFVVPAGIGLIFGLYPAAKASKLDPIEALRYE